MDKDTELSKEEIFDRIYKDVKSHIKDGKIIMAGVSGPEVFSIEGICKQPVEGLLYDLGLEEAYLAALHKDDPLEFANKMAIATIIKHLYEHYEHEE